MNKYLKIKLYQAFMAWLERGALLLQCPLKTPPQNPTWMDWGSISNVKAAWPKKEFN